MKLYIFILYLGTSVIIFALLLSIFHLKIIKPYFFKYIFIFILLGVLITVNSFANTNNIWSFSNKLARIIQEILLVFQTLMLSLFFFNILYDSIYKKIILKIILLSSVLQTVLIFFGILSDNQIKTNIVSSLSLFIFCFFFVKNLMFNKPTLILVESSAFWITIGILFYSSISFPIAALTSFIPKNPEYLNIRSQIASIFNMSLIVLYLFIIKSYLCLKHPQNL